MRGVPRTSDRTYCPPHALTARAQITDGQVLLGVPARAPGRP